MRRLLALDFDGVISDSAPESFVVAVRTYAETQPESRLTESHAYLFGTALPAPAQVAADPLYARFIEGMPLGNRAEDYAVVLRAAELDRALPDQASYDAFRDAQEPDWLRAYHRRFYELRARGAEADPEGWRRLIAPYAALLEVLRRRSGDALLAIATAKDRRSVCHLLEVYGVSDLFPQQRVLDKETGVSKVAHLEHLSSSTGLGFAGITFVDDKVNHLDSVSPLGVRCALAAWGYNGAREQRLAAERGYLVCTLDRVEAQLFG